MENYAKHHREHCLTVPQTFNFGRDVVDAWASDADKTALIWCDGSDSERSFTFSDVAERSSQVANWLTDQGIRKGERIVVMLPRIPEWQIALVGCLKVGAIPIPCITMLTEQDVAYRVRHSGAVGVITTIAEVEKFAASGVNFKARLVIGGSSTGWHDYNDVGVLATKFDACELGAEEPAIIYYTSGSTGNPKGVCHASRSLFTWRVSAQYWLSLTPQDVMWCTADTGWSKAGTSILFGPWSQGSTVLFYDGPFEPRQRFELIERYGVTVFCASATELRHLVREDLTSFDLSCLRLTVSAGESVNPEVIHEWQSQTGVELLDGYGQTETLMTVLNYPGMPVRPGSMGRPLPGVEAGILRVDGSLGGPGDEGELLIRTPNSQLMLGYWEDPDLTDQVMYRANGNKWFRTGDNVHQDVDGYFFYVGRTDDIITSSGYRVGPQEVENVLIEHPLVRESAVVGLPDPERGEIVTAFVVLTDTSLASDQLADDLQVHVKRMTAPYKYPRRVVFVAELPKTVSGKIQRNLLRRSASPSGAVGNLEISEGLPLS
ncbi:MAG: AMP-binding protein [Pseudomonadota bacterium]|nr:AMP-binding protein [Pseudomonadota bacterium]